jgi:hypothetical protein
MYVPLGPRTRLYFYTRGTVEIDVTVSTTVLGYIDAQYRRGVCIETVLVDSVCVHPRIDTGSTVSRLLVSVGVVVLLVNDT